MPDADKSMFDHLVIAALLPLWLLAAGGWAAWIAVYWLTGAGMKARVDKA